MRVISKAALEGLRRRYKPGTRVELLQMDDVQASPIGTKGTVLGVDDITVIEAIPDRILPELLPFIIQNDELFDFAVGKSAGSLSPRVKWEHLKNYEFELPDMDKQRELAELLWAMDATKKSYQKLIAATDELVKSQFIGPSAHKDFSGHTASMRRCA